MTAKVLADKAGADLPIDLNLSLGRLAAALCRSVALCNEDAGALGLATDSPWNGVAASASLVAILKALTGVALDNTTMSLIKSIIASDAIAVGANQLPPKFAPIVANASGATLVVAAVALKKLRVLGYNVIANGAVNVKFQSAGNDKTGLKYLAANGGIAPSFNPAGWFETNAGEALNINLSGAVAVGGELVYIEV
jgi:hypothetical protein